MKKRTKLALGGIATVMGILTITGCTNTFCSNTDTGRMLFAFDPGITRYVSNDAGTSLDVNVTVNEVDYTVKVNKVNVEVATWGDKGYAYADGTTLEYLNKIITSARTDGIISDTVDFASYFELVDSVYLKTLLTYKVSSQNVPVLEYDFADLERDYHFYSYLKFVESNEKSVWSYYATAIYDEVAKALPLDEMPTNDFLNYYKAKMNSYISLYRTCLTTRTDKYGSYGYKTSIYIEKKTWSYGWSRGFFEGLLVYPIGWLIDSIAFGFNSSGVSAGISALLAILFVTLIVRSLMMLTTLKQTAGNAKMTELQPEIQKIQNKYPNANTSRIEKQRMAEEMNRLYKKNKINPLSSLLTIIVQFPVFICVWGALSGSAALSSGTFLGLDLSLTIREVLFNKAAWASGGGALTALFLFLLMAAAQTVSMLLPQWMQKAKSKKVAKLGKNPAQKQQSNRMKWFTYIMLAMIIFMGFSLVSAMGVYWFVGALFSIVQTLVTQKIIARKKNK